MKRIEVRELAELNYDGKVLNVLRQYFRSDWSWSCIGSPKSCHLISFHSGMDAEYKMRDGRVFTVKDGGVVLTARGSEYSVRLCPRSGTGESIGMNFDLLIDGDDMSFNDDIIIIDDVGGVMQRLFCRAEENFFRSASPVLQKASLFRILSALGEGAASAGEINSIIQPGISYLREHFTENFSLSYLAELCHISDVYFRKLFNSQLNMTPAEYRISLRIERAKKLLAYSNLAVTEIAELLGYSEGAFFIRQFKKVAGMTPLIYRKLYSV